MFLDALALVPLEVFGCVLAPGERRARILSVLRLVRVLRVYRVRDTVGAVKCSPSLKAG